MKYEKELKKQFNAEKGSFLLIVRCELKWDKKAFRKLTSSMYHVASLYQSADNIPTWVAKGFWYCDAWIREWTNHENFPKPEHEYYLESLELLRDLAYYLFMGESPYSDNTLEKQANGCIGPDS